jgi:hypothetical protein
MKKISLILNVILLIALGVCFMSPKSFVDFTHCKEITVDTGQYESVEIQHIYKSMYNEEFETKIFSDVNTKQLIATDESLNNYLKTGSMLFQTEDGKVLKCGIYK